MNTFKTKRRGGDNALAVASQDQEAQLQSNNDEGRAVDGGQIEDGAVEPEIAETISVIQEKQHYMTDLDDDVVNLGLWQWINDPNFKGREFVQWLWFTLLALFA